MKQNKRKQIVRYCLMDLETGYPMGEEQTFTVDIFTELTEEIFCRLKDFLTYSERMCFSSDASFSPLTDEQFGSCFYAEGFWNNKKFGVLFAIS